MGGMAGAAKSFIGKAGDRIEADTLAKQAKNTFYAGSGGPAAFGTPAGAGTKTAASKWAYKK